MLKSQSLVGHNRPVRLLKRLAIVMPAVALLCLIVSVFLARSRRSRSRARGRMTRGRPERVIGPRGVHVIPQG